jgi:hypothetical protein
LNKWASLVLILAAATAGILVILFGIGCARYGSFSDEDFVSQSFKNSGYWKPQTYYPNLVPGLITIGMGAAILLVSLIALYKYHKVHKNDEKRYRIETPPKVI